jgi:hypothetical protein
MEWVWFHFEFDSIYEMGLVWFGLGWDLSCLRIQSRGLLFRYDFSEEKKGNLFFIFSLMFS